METSNKKIERVTSRIGDLPVTIPSGVEVKVDGSELKVKGKLGELSMPVMEGIEVKIDGSQATVLNAKKIKRFKANHGSMRAFLNNMIIGVSQGYTKTLLIEGVGYRAATKGSDVEINVGYSNPVLFKVPDDIKIEVEQNTKVMVKGIDKCRVGQIAAEIRKIRPPEPYKGKGIRYEDERVRKKVGKSGA